VGVDVLIADDLAYIRRMLRETLTGAGFRVVAEAASGEEAVELYQDKRPDVVVMDVTMPGMDGLTALRRLTALDPSARVILCSELGGERLVAEAMRVGASDYLVKPLRSDQIVAAVKKTLDIQ
jgi:two-component system chemotaxis response regulator CheY